MHTFNLIFKNQTNPNEGTFYKIIGMHPSKCQVDQNQGKTEEKS